MGRQLLRDEVPVGPCKVRALFSWSGETPQDLGFVEGDIIDVLNTGDGDWWTGKLKRNKLVGVFPRNFVEYVDDDQETMSAALTEKKNMKKRLTNYSLEGSGETIDFSSFSLADLQIPDPEESKKEQEKSANGSSAAGMSYETVLANARKPVPEDSEMNSKLSSSALESSQNSRNSQSRHLTPLSPLNASASSHRSTKSAQEILEDVSKEINKGFLDDVNLDAQPEELRSPELIGNGFDTSSWNFGDAAKNTGNDSLSVKHDSGIDISVVTDDGDATDQAPPVPPPHKVSVNSRKSQQHSRSTSLVPEGPVTSNNEPKSSPSTLAVPRFSASSSYSSLLSDTKPVDTAATSLASSSAKTGPVLKTPSSSALTGPVIRSKPKRGSDASRNEQHSPKLQLNNADSVANIEPGPSALERSPNLDHEIPFDPKAFKTENSIGDHIGSHFDSTTYANNTYTSNVADAPARGGDDSFVVPKTRARKAVPPQGESTLGASNLAANSGEPATVFYPSRNEDSKKSNFFQKLFPKNSQTLLRRSFSRSSRKSTKSTKSVTSRLRNVKSMFSFAFNGDDSLYPTNTLSKASRPSTADDAPPPVITRIATPPRATITGLGLSSPLLRASPQRSRHNTTTMDESSLKTSGLGGSSKEPIAGKWMETRRDLYRAKTLTERDVQKRRQELELQGVNSSNLVETLNRQNGMDFHDYRLEDFEDVDQAVRTMSTWPQLMTPSVFASSRIGRHFADPVERVRAVFLLCATRIQHVTQTPPNNNVMQSRQATPKELAATVVSMCSALDIECVAVEGHRRTAVPGSKEVSSTPHAWNVVQINGEWRILDAVAATTNSVGSLSGETNLVDAEDDEDFVNLFYFLAPPSQIIYSHVPLDHHRQYCDPLLPTASVALLPLASPAAFAHDICFDEFWLGMTRLADLEVSEFSLRVPNPSKDIVALVDGNKPVLAQPYWTTTDNTRHFRVKAFVPPHLKQTTLQLYVVPKSQTDRTPEAMELMWTIELRHVSGDKNNSPFEFVGKYAAPSAEEYDLYVLEPQCRSLGGGDTYTFKIESFDANAGRTSRNHRVKQPNIAIQSPSGRLTRLVPFGTDVHDVFRATVKTLEVGTWRAVVRADENESWVPFSEWFCS